MFKYLSQVTNFAIVNFVATLLKYLGSYSFNRLENLSELMKARAQVTVFLTLFIQFSSYLFNIKRDKTMLDE